MSARARARVASAARERCVVTAARAPSARSLKKKVVCQALRFVAHAHGATLMFVSTREKGLQNNVRVTSAYARARSVGFP